MLLSDKDSKISMKYGVWKEKNLYGKKYMGIERTTFLISKEKKIFGGDVSMTLPESINKT